MNNLNFTFLVNRMVFNSSDFGLISCQQVTVVLLLTVSQISRRINPANYRHAITTGFSGHKMPCFGLLVGAGMQFSMPYSNSKCEQLLRWESCLNFGEFDESLKGRKHVSMMDLGGGKANNEHKPVDGDLWEQSCNPEHGLGIRDFKGRGAHWMALSLVPCAKKGTDRVIIQNSLLLILE